MIAAWHTRNAQSRVSLKTPYQKRRPSIWESSAILIVVSQKNNRLRQRHLLQEQVLNIKDANTFPYMHIVKAKYFD